MAEKAQASEPTEQEVDIMADAPAERPYSEAITDAHRETLRDQGIMIEEPKKK
jgi:hypothetical protein